MSLRQIARRLWQLIFRRSSRGHSWWNDERLIMRLLARAAGISTVAATLSTEFKVSSCGNNLTGQVYNPVGTTVDIRKNYNIGTAAGNGAVGGGDEVFSFQQGITAGSSATIDLTAQTNLVQQTSVSLARIKGYQIRLLSSTDDTTLSPAPAVGSTIVVTNNGPAVPNALDFGNGGSGLTITYTVSSGAITAPSIGAAGSGYPPSSTFVVTVNQAGGSGGVIAVTTNASGVPTSVALVTGGAGYSAGTVATTVLGQYLLTTGCAHMFVDVTAAGVTISATQKNIRIYNLDGANAVTFEFSFIGGTT